MCWTMQNAMGLVTPAGNGDDSIGLVMDKTRGMPKCDEEDDNDEETDPIILAELALLKNNTDRGK